MTYGEKAAELKNTLNCAQSVAVSLSARMTLDVQYITCFALCARRAYFSFFSASI